jgi:transglutaminase-like putative cysteine protease
MPDYRGTALYHFQDLAGAESLSVSQSYLVQTWDIETEVDPDKIQKPEEASALMAAYTQPDSALPSAAPEIQAAARKICQGEKNPWRAARSIYDYLVKNVAYREGGPALKPVQALAAKGADPSGYALLAASLLRAAGVPALPVQGYLVDSTRKAARHAWVEFYVYGFGWVPMDPILGSGASPGGLFIAFEDRSRYFGNLDSRRVAFSRGFTVLSPMTQSGRYASPAKPVALQSFYEEASGALDSYSSFWSEVEFSGMY